MGGSRSVSRAPCSRADLGVRPGLQVVALAGVSDVDVVDASVEGEGWVVVVVEGDRGAEAGARYRGSRWR